MIKNKCLICVLVIRFDVCKVRKIIFGENNMWIYSVYFIKLFIFYFVNNVM